MVAATLVEELGQPALRYFVLWLQSTLALIEGLFEDAEKLADESFELGVSANHPDAAVVHGTQLVVFAWQRGDTTALVEPTLDILTRVPDLPAWRSALALVLALGGRPDDARAELIRVTQSLDNLTFTSDVDTGVDRAHGGRPPARRAERGGPAVRGARRLPRPHEHHQPEPERDGSDQPCARGSRGSAGGPCGGGRGTSTRRWPSASASDHLRTPRARRWSWLGCCSTGAPTATSIAARELLDVALPSARELGMGGVLLDILQLKSAVS